MNTKEKILETALKLFNEQGTDVITVRHIAKEVGISHGNLCYHFPNTDAIIDRLYDQLVDQLSARVEAVTIGQAVTLSALVNLANESLKTLQEYQFLMLDFAGIMRRIPALRERHRTLVIGRKQAFRYFLQQLRITSLIRTESYPGYDEDLLEQLFIVGDFWLASAAILQDGSNEEQLRHYQRVFRALIAPLLTEKGLAEWQAINQRSD